MPQCRKLRRAVTAPGDPTISARNRTLWVVSEPDATRLRPLRSPITRTGPAIVIVAKAPNPNHQEARPTLGST